MASTRTSTARRREVRRTLHQKGDVHWWAGGFLRRPEVLWSCVFVVLFAVLGGLVALQGRDKPRYAVDQMITEPIVARVSFKAVDKAATQKGRELAERNEPACYDLNTDFIDQVKTRFDELIAPALDANITSAYSEEMLTALRRFVQTPQAPQGDASAPAKATTTQEWRDLTRQFVDKLAHVVVLEEPRIAIERDLKKTQSPFIRINHPNDGEVTRRLTTLIGIDELTTFRNNLDALAKPFGPQIGPIVVARVLDNAQPTYLFNERETQRRRALAFNNMQLIVERTYEPNAVLVPVDPVAGHRITSLELDIVAAERARYLEDLSPFKLASRRAAVFTIMLLLGAGLWAYVIAYQPRITRNASRGLALTALLIGGQALAIFFAGLQPVCVAFTGTFFTLLATMVLVIAYDQRFALAIGAVHTILVTMSLNIASPFAFGITLLAGVALTVGMLNQVRTRSKLMKVGAISGAGMAVVTITIGLMQRPIGLHGAMHSVGLEALLALASGFAAGLVAHGVLPAIERAFQVTTAMTLKELNDASHPLLRRVAAEAPGTYQHSLRLADLAESAADAIGANALLCKVGAMYHDVGKSNKPHYFIENQGDSHNRHDKLQPAMSVLIIVGHVKDGNEMAREYHLPPAIRHFIESHHGTTLVEYFYHAAKKRSSELSEPKPMEFEYRYPGPKPQTREAAIMMLADSVESAARSLSEPPTARLEQLVHTIAQSRLLDGQFDESNLTLSELHKIENAVTKTLCAVYHTRIAYPGQEKPQHAGHQSQGQDQPAAAAT